MVKLIHIACIHIMMYPFPADVPTHIAKINKLKAVKTEKLDRLITVKISDAR